MSHQWPILRSTLKLHLKDQSEADLKVNLQVSLYSGLPTNLEVDLNA